MSVRAVTPRVVAISGHVQIHRDADGYDLEQDSRWDEVAGSDFYPDPSFDDFLRGSNGQRTRGARPVATPMNAVPGHTAGCHRRPGTATSSPDRGEHTPGSDLAACEVALSGAPETLLHTHSGASTSSDERGARRSPGAS